MQLTNINVRRAKKIFRDRTYLQLEVVVGKYYCTITQYLRNNERYKKLADTVPTNGTNCILLKDKAKLKGWQRGYWLVSYEMTQQAIQTCLNSIAYLLIELNCLS